MIIKYNLFILALTIDFEPLHIILSRLLFGVDIDDLPVALVAKEQALVSTARIHLEVGTVVGNAHIGAPVVVRQVGCFWQ